MNTKTFTIASGTYDAETFQHATRIMSDAQLDALDLPNDWASIPNPKQVGTKDQWLVGHIDAPEIKAWREAHGFVCIPETDGQLD